MPAVTQSEGLVVWTQPNALDEARSLFAPYSPKFQTVPCDVKTAFRKTSVSVLYLSSPAQDTTVENTLATLRNCKVSTLLVYTPHHSADFAFRVGTMVVRQKLAEAEWRGRYPRSGCRIRQTARGPACLSFNAKQRAAIKRWIGQVAPLKGVYFRSVEYRYMDPKDVLSGSGTRRYGGRFAVVGTRAVYFSVTDSGASKEVTARKAPFGGAAQTSTDKYPPLL